MPILGIMASGISGNLWAPSGSYDSIATAYGTGSSGTISFTSIPSTFTHLQLRVYGGVATTATSSSFVYFNNDTTAANYASHFLRGNGAGAATAGAATADATLFDNNGVSASPMVAIVDILDYANSSKNKTSRALNGYDANGSGRVTLQSQVWLSTSAINRLDIVASQNWGTYSSFALYGVK